MLNKKYLKALPELTEHFEKNGQISLREIVDPEIFSSWKTPSVTRDVRLLTHKYSSGVWNDMIEQLVSDEVFQSFLAQLIGTKYSISEKEYIELGHGDYALRSQCSSGVMFVFDVGDELGYGADLCFATDSDTAIIPSAPNTLSLVHVDSNTERFFTYATHHVEGKKRRVYIGLIF